MQRSAHVHYAVRCSCNGPPPAGTLGSVRSGREAHAKRLVPASWDSTLTTQWRGLAEEDPAGLAVRRRIGPHAQTGLAEALRIKERPAVFFYTP